jgi:hypothetical protein
VDWLLDRLQSLTRDQRLTLVSAAVVIVLAAGCNGVIRTVDPQFAVVAAHKRTGLRHTPGLFNVDPWGNPWRVGSPPESPGNRRTGSYSFGPNRVDEKGNGDDLFTRYTRSGGVLPDAQGGFRGGYRASVYLAAWLAPGLVSTALLLVWLAFAWCPRADRPDPLVEVKRSILVVSGPALAIYLLAPVVLWKIYPLRVAWRSLEAAVGPGQRFFVSFPTATFLTGTFVALVFVLSLRLRTWPRWPRWPSPRLALDPTRTDFRTELAHACTLSVVPGFLLLLASTVGFGDFGAPTCLTVSGAAAAMLLATALWWRLNRPAAEPVSN